MLRKFFSIQNFEIMKNGILCIYLFDKKYNDNFWDFFFEIFDFEIFKNVFDKYYQKNY